MQKIRYALLFFFSLNHNVCFGHALSQEVVEETADANHLPRSSKKRYGRWLIGLGAAGTGLVALALYLKPKPAQPNRLARLKHLIDMEQANSEEVLAECRHLENNRSIDLHRIGLPYGGQRIPLLFYIAYVEKFELLRAVSNLMDPIKTSKMRNPAGETLLTWAIKEKKQALVNQLCATDHLPKEANTAGDTPLMLFAREKNISKIKDLVEVKKVHLTSNIIGESALTISAKNEETNGIGTYLLRNGTYASNKEKVKDHHQAFAAACKHRNQAFLAKLMDHTEIDPTFKSGGGRSNLTLLDLLAQSGCQEIIERFEEAKKLSKEQLSNAFTTALKYEKKEFAQIRQKRANGSRLDKHEQSIEENEMQDQTAMYNYFCSLQLNWFHQNICQESSIQMAARKGAIELLDFMLISSLQSNKKINQRDRYGRTALSDAAQNGHLAVVRRLLEEPQIEVYPSKRFAFSDRAQEIESAPVRLAIPVQLAIQNGHQQIARLLMDYKNKAGNTWLSDMCAEGNINAVNSLLARYQPDTNTQNKAGNTPLMRAIKGGHSEISLRLQEVKGLNVGIKNTHGADALDIAVQHNDTRVGRGLLKIIKNYPKNLQFERFSRQDAEKNNVLHKMAQKGLNDLLIDLFCTIPLNEEVINMRNKEGNTLFIEAVKHQYLGLVKFLLGKQENTSPLGKRQVRQIDIRGRNTLNLNAFSYAMCATVQVETIISKNKEEAERVAQRKREIKDLIIQQVIDSYKERFPDQLDELLFDACSASRLETVRYIYLNFYDLIHPDYVDSAGNGFLHAAVLNGNIELVGYVIYEIKAPTGITNSAGRDALYLATHLKKNKVAKYLVCAGALLTDKTLQLACRTHNTDLMHYYLANACAKDRIDQVTYLLATNQIDLHYTDGEGNTLLHIAAQNNALKVCLTLLNLPNNRWAISQTNNAYLTPQMLARKHRYKLIWQVLNASFEQLKKTHRSRSVNQQPPMPPTVVF